MKQFFTRKNVLASIAIILVVIQFFRIDKTILAADPSKDFISLTKPNGEVAGILKNSCYDCHSNQPQFPWYTNVAPVSWWIGHHMNEGKHHLNFSEWGDYKSRRKDHKLDECVEMLEEGEMPLASYEFIHDEAELTEAQEKILTDWFNSLRTYESEVKEKN